jgi:hypothetical protein
MLKMTKIFVTFDGEGHKVGGISLLEKLMKGLNDAFLG